MKTKVNKTSTPAPAVEQREPTDEELRALQDDDVADSDGELEAAATQTFATAGIGSTPIDLARLGLNQIAYIRRTVVDEQPIWAIHSASGHPLGAATTFEQAWGAVVQNELQPMYVN